MLHVRDLSCARGGVPILAGVSFDLAPGEALILRGPNGIGKTTLLRVLAGLQPPLAGHVEGQDELAYAGHADGLKAMLSATENLQFWAAAFGQSDRVAEALAAYDLTGLAGRRAASLSAGQKRRLGLARMLVTGRKVWAFDEPTVSLDAASVARFAAAVSAHLAQGGAAIMATHIDLGLAGRVLDLTAHKAAPEAAASAFDEAFL